MANQTTKHLKKKDILKNECGTIIKKGGGHPSIALAYANTYHVGMSNLGFHALYALFNKDPQCVCERVFLDFQETPELRTFETNQRVQDSDVLAFSISFEHDYLNVPFFLERANIPFYARERHEEHPLVIAGGTAVTINPEPIREFCDVLVIGEAETLASEILTALRSSSSRQKKLEALAQLDNCHVTQDIKTETVSDAVICTKPPYDTLFNKRVSSQQLSLYKKRTTRNLDLYPTNTIIHTPHTEFGDTTLIEVQRGCSYGCKFCAECFVATPFRQRNMAVIKKQISENINHRKKIGLIGTNLLRFPDFLELCAYIHELGGQVSPSSLRADDLTEAVIKVLKQSGHKTIAIAPEAGSDRLRKTLNKHLTNEHIIRTIDHICSEGIPRIKMYLMIGLPQETQEDILCLIELVKQAREQMLTHAKTQKKVTELVMSINPFIPKPRTPFQNEYFSPMDELKEKAALLKKELQSLGNIQLNFENPFSAYIQALLSNGSSFMSEMILACHKQKGKLKQVLKNLGK